MTYVPSSNYLPPPMPGAAKQPFWTKGKLFIVGLVALAILGGNSNKPNYSQAEPVATVAKTESPSVKFGDVVDLDMYDNQEVGAAVMGIYHMQCKNLPLALDNYVADYMERKGKKRMMEIINKVDVARMVIGNEKWCAMNKKLLGQL